MIPQSTPFPLARNRVTRSRQGRPHHFETGGPPLLSTVTPDTETAAGHLRPFRRAEGRGPFLTERQNAQPVTCRQSSPSRAGTWHKADDIGIDDFQAKRSPDERYRTTPLRALWDTTKVHKGGFYHDGRFKTLAEVVEHYGKHLNLNLDEQEEWNLIEY